MQHSTVEVVDPQSRTSATKQDKEAGKEGRPGGRTRDQKKSRETEHRYISACGNSRAEGRPRSMRKSSRTGSQQSGPSLRLATRPKQKEGQEAGEGSQVAGFMYTRKKMRQSNEGLRGSLRAVYANRPGSTQGQLGPVETKTRAKNKS